MAYLVGGLVAVVILAALMIGGEALASSMQSRGINPFQ